MGLLDYILGIAIIPSFLVVIIIVLCYDVFFKPDAG